MEIRRGYLQSALAAGVERLDAEVIGLEPTAGGLRVRTSAGDQTAAVVVNAAGAWGGQLAAMAGVDVPVHRFGGRWR